MGGKYNTIEPVYYNPYSGFAKETVDKGLVTTEQIADSMALFRRVVERIVRFMPENLSTYDKYYYLAVVICQRASYNVEAVNAYSAFGNLIDGESVCEGYSKAFAILCKEAGLWCGYKYGLPEGEGHVWNVIKLESGIYNVDITWCDTYPPNKYIWYENFCKTDGEFATHEINDGILSTGTGEFCPFDRQE